MPPSRTIARLVGPAIIAITLTEIGNRHIFAHSSPVVVYLNGSILFVAGLAIAQAHNVWSLRPVVLITLIGWVTMGLGLFRMVYPEKMLEMAKEEAGVGIAAALVCLVGVCVCALGYWPPS